jgi:ATPase subunit of ABC transporter with duplicated ATPase domains
VTKIAEIDGGEITVYSGNYDFYERERAIREANREAAYARQQAMLAKEQRFIDRFQGARGEGRAGAEPRQGARQDREDRAAEEAAQGRRRFDFRQPPRSGEQVAVLEAFTRPTATRVIYDGLNLTIRAASGGA